MKRISIILGAALLGIAALASCNKDARISENADLGINFRVSSGAITKATPTTVANISAFKVTAIGNGTNFFTDLDVAVSAAGACTPAETYYWPGYELGFYAYANPSGGTASIANAAKGISGVTPVAAAADQQDFVIAYQTGTKAANMASGVALNFRHALSQIKVKAANKSTAGLKINVKGVKIANAKASGNFSYPAAVTAGNNAATLDFALWNSSATAKTAYTIGGASETAVALSATAADIMFSGGSWMLVPQQLVAWNLASDKTNSNANAYIGVYLQILDASNGQLYPATAGEYAYANVPIDTKWEPGKCYTYTLNFLDEAAGGGAGVDDNGDPVLGSPINFTLTVDDWAVNTESTSSNDLFDLEVETPVTAASPASFGGLQLAPGNLYYDGSDWSIDNAWDSHCTYNVAYGVTPGTASSFFNFLEMGALFEKAGFSTTDGDIENVLDPLDGWRLPTQAEWAKLITTSSAVREGSTVNGRANTHWNLVNVTGISYAGQTSILGLILFPDGITITGASMDHPDAIDDINSDYSSITSSQLDTYLEYGCAFLPAGGYCSTGSNDNWNAAGSVGSIGLYLSGTEENKYSACGFGFMEIGLAVDYTEIKGYGYFCIRLVRE